MDTISITIEDAKGFGKNAHQRDVICLGQKLATSDEPEFVAARILYNRGVPPETKLIIQTAYQRKRHTTVAEAAKLENTNFIAYPKPAPGRYEPFLKRLELAQKRGRALGALPPSPAQSDPARQGDGLAAPSSANG